MSRRSGARLSNSALTLRLTIAQWLTWSRASSAGRDTPSWKPVKDWFDKGLKGRADTTVEIVRGLTPLDAHNVRRPGSYL